MALGHNIMLVDEDGPVRQIIPFVRRDGLFLPSLGVVAAQMLLGVRSADVVLEGEHLRLGRTRLPVPRVAIPRFDAQAGPPQFARQIPTCACAGLQHSSPSGQSPSAWQTMSPSPPPPQSSAARQAVPS